MTEIPSFQSASKLRSDAQHSIILSQLSILQKASRASHLWVLRQIKDLFELLDHPNNLIKQKAISLLFALVHHEPRILNKAIPKLMMMLLHSQSLSMNFHILKFFIENAFKFSVSESHSISFPEKHIFIDQYRQTIIAKIQHFFENKDNNLIFLGIDLLNRFTLNINALYQRTEAFAQFTRKVDIKDILAVVNINQAKVAELVELKLPLKLKHKICEILFRMFRYQTQVDVTPEMIQNFSAISRRSGVLFWPKRGLRSLIPDYIEILKVFKKKGVSVSGFLDQLVQSQFAESSPSSQDLAFEDFKVVYSFLMQNLKLASAQAKQQEVLIECCRFLEMLIRAADPAQKDSSFRYFSEEGDFGEDASPDFSNGHFFGRNFLNLFSSVFFNIINCLALDSDLLALTLQTHQKSLNLIILFMVRQRGQLSEHNRTRLKIVLFRLNKQMIEISKDRFVERALMLISPVDNFESRFGQFQFLLN